MKIKATVSYDGSAYSGFQKQINALGIQDVLEKALSKIHKKPTPVVASGRTDAGVHALGQVFHFEMNEKIGLRGYYEALNTLLPKDIRITKVEAVPDDFHARFSARKKRYEYVYTLERDNPFVYRYKTILKRQPDLQAMKQAAEVFLGRHDFTSFTNAKIPPEKSRVKTIERIEIRQEGKDIRLIYEADGFLRYQVRMMTAVLQAAGEHRLRKEDIQAMLEARDKEVCRYNAPAQGLYLKEVTYDDPAEPYECYPASKSAAVPADDHQVL